MGVFRAMSISRTSRMRRRPAARRLPLGLPLGALLLAACGDFAENIPPRPAASDDPAIVDAPYPNLAAVPARPQLGYTLEQRREIARGLVADRANARHAGDTLRGDLGRPVEPDTVPALPPLPEVEPPPVADPEADLALAYVEEALARDSDDGSLGDFLDRLERPPPASAEAAPAPAPAPVPSEPIPPDPATPDPVSSLPPASAAIAAAAVAAPPPVARDPVPEVAAVEPPAAEPEAAAPVPAAVSVVAEPADRSPPEVAAVPPEPVPPVAEAAPVVAATAAAPPSPTPTAEVAVPAAQAVVATAPAAVATPPATTVVEPLALPLAVLFEPGEVQVGDESRARLDGIARQLRGHGATIVVSGGGARAGLAMERARRVAALLVGSGVPPGRIVIEMGGERDAVVVYEADA